MRPRALHVAVATLLLAAVLPATAAPSTSLAQAAVAQPTSPPSALAAFYSQRLQWERCRGTMACADFRVPLDYDKPQGRTLTIRVARVQATGTSRGPLVVNPGGPGGSAIDYLQDPAYAVSSTARRNFDLIGFDPRGVGASAPLWCLRGTALDAFLEVDPTPDTPAEEAAVAQAGRTLAQACQREDAALMAHVSTVEIARDMDVLRALLGQERLRYLGKSWGSVLGTAYAALFPGRVGSFVLDGAVDVRASARTAVFQQGAGFEEAANRFVAWCRSQGECPLGATQAAAKARLVRFLRDVDAKPLPTNNRQRPLTEAQAIIAIIGPLYVSSGGFDWLLAALTPALEEGRGQALQAIADWFVERDAKGRYGSNANTAIYAINCLDGAGAVSSTAQARALAAKWRSSLPFMGSVMAWGDLPCAAWPYRAKLDPSTLRVRAVPPMLVVSATHDPATPLRWGQALTAQLPGARLLVREGDGHTSYADGNLCIDRAVDAFLLSRDPLRPSLPPVGKRCG